MILDVGASSIATIDGAIEEARTLVWNGPLGAFELTPFDTGTVAVAQHAARRTKAGQLVSVAGGGDTVAALNHAGVGLDGAVDRGDRGGADIEDHRVGGHGIDRHGLVLGIGLELAGHQRIDRQDDGSKTSSPRSTCW
jgi:hypothetical protein